MATRAAPPTTKPTTVIMVRHGTTSTTGKILPGRAPGLHLSDLGRDQAVAAAERIALIGDIAAVYASPMERTRETAAPIARTTGCRVRVRRGLIECDFGDWTGKKLSALSKLPEWKQVQGAPSVFRFPGGESFVEMQTRISTSISELVAEHPGETIVCVSHADPIKAAVAHAQGTHLDLFQRIVISPCSLSLVMFGAGSPIVLAVNSLGDDLSLLRPS